MRQGSRKLMDLVPSLENSTVIKRMQQPQPELEPLAASLIPRVRNSVEQINAELDWPSSSSRLMVFGCSLSGLMMQIEAV